MLIQEAFQILSKANEKIASLGVDYVDQEGSPKQPKTLQELIRIRQLYNLINKFVFFNTDGTAINGTFGQNDSAINRLLLILKRKAEIFPSPSLPNPIHSFITTTGSSTFSLPVSGSEGDLLYFHNGSWVNFAKGGDGTVLTSSPTGILWSTAVGNGLPSGGAQGQFLKKNSNASYDTIWDTINPSDINGVTVSAAEINYSAGLSEPIIDSLSAINVALASKMSSSLANGNFFVGNASDIATAQSPSGDVTFDNLGVFAITTGSIVDLDINASAAISRSKIAGGTANRLVVNDSVTGLLHDANAITANRLLVSDSNGLPIASAIDASIVPYLDPNSSVQGQLDGKLDATITSAAEGDILIYNGTTFVNYGLGANGTVLTSNGTTAIWGSATANGLPTGGTTHQYLRKASDSDFDTEWETFTWTDISGISTTSTEINQLSGLTVNATNLNYTSDVTAPIQEQIDNKLGRALGYNNIWVGNASNVAADLAPGIDGDVLTMVGTSPKWQPQTPPGNVSGVGPTTDNAIARWNGTSADSIQNSGIIIDDSNNVDGIANLRLNDASAIRTGASNANTFLLQAYDVDGAAYTTFATLTAGNTPTMNLADAVTINSAYIYRVGGTDVSLADGGTGASLSDPGANKILAWDDTDNSIGFWTLGSGLTYDHSTHTLSATGSGSVGGPVSSTDNAIARWDGTTGTVIQDSGIIIDDSNNVSGVASLTGTTGAAIRTGTSNTNTILLQAYNTTGSSYTTFATLTAAATPTFDLNSTTTIGTSYIYRAGGTDVSLADGGTGASLVAPSADRIMFYDFSALSTAYLQTGTTLSISGTTINVSTNGIANSNIRQSAALSIIGNATNATANVDDISSSADGDVLRRSGTTLGFGSITGTSLSLSNGSGTTWNGTSKVYDLGGTASAAITVDMSGNNLSFINTNAGIFDGAKYEITGTAATIPTNASITTKSYVLGSKTFTGKQIFSAPTVSAASVNFQSGTAPTSPNDGDVWYSSNTLNARINGTTVQLGGGGTWGSITGTLSAQTDLQSALDAKNNLLLSHNTQTVNYTLVLSDYKSKVVEMNVASANTVTVPPNSSVAFPVGSQIPIFQYGTGLTTIVPGSGVTIHSSNGSLNSVGRYTPMFLEKRGTDEWYLFNGTASFTNSAANTELIASDGVNGISSKIFIPSSGNITFGDSTSTGPFYLRTASTIASGPQDLIIKPGAVDTYLRISRQGIGEQYPYLILGGTSDDDTQRRIITTQGNISTAAASLYVMSGQFFLSNEQVNVQSAGAVAATFTFEFTPSLNSLFLYKASDRSGIFSAGYGNSSINNGGAATFKGGDAYQTSGNGNGGNTTVKSGAKRSSGSGTDGNVIIDPLTGFLDIKVAPSVDSSPVINHKVPVKFNGTTYYIILTDTP